MAVAGDLRAGGGAGVLQARAVRAPVGEGARQASEAPPVARVSPVAGAGQTGVENESADCAVGTLPEPSALP